MTIPLIKLAAKKHDAAARQPFIAAQVLAREAPETSLVRMFWHARQRCTRALDVDQGWLAMLMATIIFDEHCRLKPGKRRRKDDAPLQGCMNLIRNRSHHIKLTRTRLGLCGT